jgi:hypothetical protein
MTLASPLARFALLGLNIAKARELGPYRVRPYRDRKGGHALQCKSCTTSAVQAPELRGFARRSNTIPKRTNPHDSEETARRPKTARFAHQRSLCARQSSVSS